MKKFTKICLITALVLAVAGAVLTGAGMVSGASFQKFAENMEKSGVGYTNKIYWLDRIDERMEHFEDRVEHYSEKWEEKWDDDHWENEEAYTETRSFEVSRVECLIVEAYAGSIEIKPGTGDEIKISNLTDMDTVELKQLLKVLLKKKEWLLLMQKYSMKSSDDFLITTLPSKQTKNIQQRLPVKKQNSIFLANPEKILHIYQ